MDGRRLASFRHVATDAFVQLAPTRWIARKRMSPGVCVSEDVVGQHMGIGLRVVIAVKAKMGHIRATALTSPR